MFVSSSGLVDEKGRVLSNEHLGCSLYLVKLESPRIAQSLAPGQFVHTQLPGMEGHILRRPFSVYDTQPEEGIIEILYQVVGYGSAHLSTLQPGAEVANIGPVGRGWQAPADCKRVLLVGGGVGAAPLFLFSKQLVGEGVQVDVVLGAQTAEAMVADKRYEDALGHPPVIATDDGTLGYAGFCTQPAQQLLDENEYDFCACCGPQPLMRIVAGMAKERKVPCQVSMERRMACGVGACLSCVIDTTEGKQRCCVDGPVFDAEEVVW